MANIQESILISCKKENVWECLEQAGHLEFFHPFCQVNKPLLWNDSEEKIDEIIYLSNLTYKRVFVKWNQDNFTLFIHKDEKAIAKVSWFIQEKQNQSEVKIVVKPKANSLILRIIYPLLVPLYLKPKLKQYLKSVLTGLKYYIDNKQPTPRNLLGKHPWYS